MKRVSGAIDETGYLLGLGRAVRQLRSEQGMSQEALAFAAKIDRSHMGKIERGERNVTILNILRIAHALEHSASELLRSAETEIPVSGAIGESSSD